MSASQKSSVWSKVTTVDSTEGLTFLLDGKTFATAFYKFDIMSDTGGTVVINFSMEGDYPKVEIQFDLIASADRTRFNFEGDPSDTYMNIISDDADIIIGHVLDDIIRRINARKPWDHTKEASSPDDLIRLLNHDKLALISDKSDDLDNRDEDVLDTVTLSGRTTEILNVEGQQFLQLRDQATHQLVASGRCKLVIDAWHPEPAVEVNLVVPHKATISYDPATDICKLDISEGGKEADKSFIEENKAEILEAAHTYLVSKLK